MALGHEKLDVYRLAAMMSRLGKRGFSVQEEPSSYGIDPDPDFDSDSDFDEIKPNQTLHSTRTSRVSELDGIYGMRMKKISAGLLVALAASSTFGFSGVDPFDAQPSANDWGELQSGSGSVVVSGGKLVYQTEGDATNDDLFALSWNATIEAGTSFETYLELTIPIATAIGGTGEAAIEGGIALFKTSGLQEPSPNPYVSFGLENDADRGFSSGYELNGRIGQLEPVETGTFTGGRLLLQYDSEAGKLRFATSSDGGNTWTTLAEVDAGDLAAGETNSVAIYIRSELLEVVPADGAAFDDFGITDSLTSLPDAPSEPTADFPLVLVYGDSFDGDQLDTGLWTGSVDDFDVRDGKLFFDGSFPLSFSSLSIRNPVELFRDTVLDVAIEIPDAVSPPWEAGIGVLPGSGGTLNFGLTRNSQGNLEIRSSSDSDPVVGPSDAPFALRLVHLPALGVIRCFYSRDDGQTFTFFVEESIGSPSPVFPQSVNLYVNSNGSFSSETLEIAFDDFALSQINPDDGSISVTVLAGQGGSVTPFGVQFVEPGSTVSVAAFPWAGYLFDGWSGIDRTSSSFEVDVIEPLRITALFEPDGSDADEDGLTAFQEGQVYFSNPALPDSNFDGVEDGEAVQSGFTPLTDFGPILQIVREDPDRFDIEGAGDPLSLVRDLNLPGVLLEGQGQGDDRRVDLTLTLETSEATLDAFEPETTFNYSLDLPEGVLFLRVVTDGPVAE